MRSAVWAVALFSAALVGQEVRVTGGVADDQVLQRNAENRADLNLSGTIAGKRSNGKAIEARLVSGPAVVRGFDWIEIGRAQRQKWSGELKGIPAGGPYKLEVRAAGSHSVYFVDGLLVGDLWVLAGQSNMEGVGDLIDVQPPIAQVHSFDMADHWAVAREPLHTLVSAADRVHWRLNENKEPERWTGERLDAYIAGRKKGAGLGLAFAEEMFRRTSIPVGLVPCAHGGTSMAQWDPALKDRGGDSLYGSMLRRFRAVGGRVKGVLWYQGESDTSAKAAPLFQQKFQDFVKAVRNDFEQPNLPFYYVQIGRHVNNQNGPEWNSVQDQQLRAEAAIPRSAMVAAVDLSLDDPIHVSTPDLKRLGFRLANLACHDLFPQAGNCGDLKPGPRPVSARFSNGAIKVVFTGVNGKLQSEGRIAGFAILDQKGEPVPLIYKAKIDPAEASTVVLYVGGKLPDKAGLRYGYGKNPYCNLRDAADMAVPAFGPVLIE